MSGFRCRTGPVPRNGFAVLHCVSTLRVRVGPARHFDRHRGRGGRGPNTKWRDIMATIGTFKRDENGFTGVLTTLTLNSKVRLVRSEGDNEKAPSHRLFAGKSEIGAAWAKTSKEGKPYLSAKLDDPSFTSAIYATLIEDADTAGAFSLIWSRRTQD